MKLRHIFIIGLFLRLLLAVVIPTAGDIDAWRHYSTYWQHGLYSPYDEICRYKYSPFWFWIISFVSYVSGKTGVPFGFAIRLPIIASDVVLFWLIRKSCQKLQMSSKQTFIIVTAFFLNPISLQISGFYGQFDNMSILIILAAWYAYSFFPRNNFLWTLAFLNLSLLVKHFTVMLVPAFSFIQKSWPKKISTALLSPALFMAVLIPYWIQNTHWVNVNVFQYKLGSGYWGWLGVVCRGVLLLTGYDMIKQPWFEHFSIYNPLLYLGIIAASYQIVKRYSLLDSFILILLIFYSFTIEMAPQYTIWILPFAVFRPNRYLLAYSVIGGIQLGLFYYSHYHWFFKYPIVHLYSEAFVIFRYLTWIVCVLWLFDFLKSKNKTALS